MKNKKLFALMATLMMATTAVGAFGGCGGGNGGAKRQARAFAGAERHSDGESYSIPYRSLIPKGLDNVLVAGRCIGADRPMQASMRVIPCCYITGQAAGAAASVCVEDSVCARDASFERIKERIPV